MRLLHYLDNFDFGLGGVVQYVYQVARVLAAHGTDVTLVVGKNKDVPKEWLQGDAPNRPRVHILKSPPGIQSWLSNSQLNEIQDVVKGHDVVHLHGAWDLGNVRLSHRLRQHRIPYIVSSHGMLDDWSVAQKRLKKAIFIRLISRSFLRRAALVHCTARGEMEQVERNVSGIHNTICVVPYVVPGNPAAVDEDLAYETFPTINRDRLKLLFLSRIHEKKGPEHLLKATAELKRRGLLIQALMTGPGDESYINKLKRLAEERGIEQQVLWLGMVRDPLKTALYRAADIFVLPTQQENFGIVLVEAMFAGLPIITTRGTDIYQELEQGGALISGLSGNQIADAVQQLLAEPRGMRTRSERGMTFAKNWLDEARNIQDHLAMYGKATEQYSA